MEFKNEFEHVCFDAVGRVLEDKGVELRHNHVLAADFRPGKGVISFTGPPKKEIDVLVAKLTPDFTLLVSMKDYEKPAPPLAIQEWASVVRTMDEHSNSTSYIGLVVCSHGFSSGCVAWAIDANIGMVPPQKGKTISYDPDVVPEMLEGRILPKGAFLGNWVST